MNDADRKIVESWLHYVESALSAQLKHPIVLWASDADKVRLLNLRVWRDRHKVSLDFILSAVLPFWLNRKFRVPRSDRLGVRVSSLVGQKSYAILLDTIQKVFPNDENISNWQAEQVQRVHGLSLWYARDLETLERDYKTHLQKVALKQKEVVRRLKRRRYRGNPFIPE